MEGKIVTTNTGSLAGLSSQFFRLPLTLHRADFVLKKKKHTEGYRPPLLRQELVKTRQPLCERKLSVDPEIPTVATPGETNVTITTPRHCFRPLYPGKFKYKNAHSRTPAFGLHSNLTFEYNIHILLRSPQNIYMFSTYLYERVGHKRIPSEPKNHRNVMKIES